MARREISVETRYERVLERLKNSASGFVTVKRFGVPDRTALLQLKEEGKVELFTSGLGPAYRLIQDSPSDESPTDET